MIPIRALFATLFLIVSSGHAHAQDESALLDALVAAYPDALARHDRKSIAWRDGTTIQFGDAAARRPLQGMIRHRS